MKMTHLAVAAALALVPATATLANDAKKEALKKAKEKMKEAAKEKAQEKTANLKAAAATRTSAAPAATNNAAAQQTERETHARNLGVIERLQQIAVATSDANLKVAVERLNGKEGRRHDLALATM